MALPDTTRVFLMELAEMRPSARRRLLRGARKIAAQEVTEANSDAVVGACVTVTALEAIAAGRDPHAAVAQLTEVAGDLYERDLV